MCVEALVRLNSPLWPGEEKNFAIISFLLLRKQVTPCVQFYPQNTNKHAIIIILGLEIANQILFFMEIEQDVELNDLRIL
jgi:hypothetical protein